MQNNYNIVAQGYSINEIHKLTGKNIGTLKGRASGHLDNIIVVKDGKTETTLIVQNADILFIPHGEEIPEGIESCKREGFLASILPSISKLLLELRQSKSDLQRDISTVTVRLNKCSSAKTELQQQFDSSKELLQQHSDTIEILESQVDDLENQLDVSKLSGSSTSTQVENLRTKLAEAQDTIEKMKVAFGIERNAIVSGFDQRLLEAKAFRKKFAKRIANSLIKKYEDQRTAKEVLADKRLSWVLTLLTIVTVSVTVVSCMSMFGIGDIYHSFMGGAVSCAFILTAIANSMIQQSDTSNLKKGASGGLMVMMGAAAYYMHHNTFSKVFQDEANGWFAIGLATFFIFMEIASIWFRRK